ncbi:MAG: CapA family protein [Minisyncoccia bacterium]
MEKSTAKEDGSDKTPIKKAVLEQVLILDAISDEKECIVDEVEGAVSFLSALKKRRGFIIKRSLIAGLIIFVMTLFFSFVFWFINSFERNYPSVLNFGDIMLDRGVRNIIEKSKRDPFVNIKKEKNLLDKYDFVVVNLEGPIVEMNRSDCQQKLYNFQFPKDSANRLKTVGINVVNIANNHTYDCFKVGLQNTKENLTKSGVSFMGDREIEKSYVIKEVDKKKIVFIGIDVTTMPISITKFYSLIKDLKLKYDYIVVNIHWGEEYSMSQTDSQTHIAHNLVDSGADVIFGHHPHVVEPMEVYKNSVIFYSLGNFVFDQDFGNTTVGLGAGVEFKKKSLSVTVYPINIKRFTPEFMKGQEKLDFCERYLSQMQNVGCSFEVLR